MAQNKRIWDYLNAITHTKDLSVLTDPDFDKVYQPFLINRALSQHEDSVLAAQTMNERFELPAKAQFLFLLNTLRARKRYSDWLKHTVSDDEHAVAEYYSCGLRHARELVLLHTSEQLATVHRRIYKGDTTRVRVHDTGTQRTTTTCRSGDS